MAGLVLWLCRKRSLTSLTFEALRHDRLSSFGGGIRLGFVTVRDGIGLGLSGFKPIEITSAEEGHLVDALAPRGDEGRGTLRKAAGSCEQALIRGFPNGETRPFRVIAV